MTEHSSSHPADRLREPNPDQLDRERILALTEKTTQPGACFGREVVLSPEDRDQISLITSLVTWSLDAPIGALLDELDDYQRLVDEGLEKGVLFDSPRHLGQRVPMHTVDGGKGTPVGKILRDGDQPGIVVPTEVFSLLHWMGLSSELRSYGIGGTSNEALHGRSTKALGEGLSQIGHYLSEMGIIDSREETSAESS